MTTNLQRRDATTICTGAATPAALMIANQIAIKATGCNCTQLTTIDRAIADDDTEFLEICAPDLLEQIHAFAYDEYYL